MLIQFVKENIGLNVPLTHKIFVKIHQSITLYDTLDRPNGDCILLAMLHYDFSVHTAQNEASIEQIS